MRLHWLLPLLWLACRPAVEPSRPNILFVMADDHTAQAWGIYGGVLADHIQTPAIQRLADEGVVLNRAYCTNSLCVPSRASILTSQYSHQNQVFTLDDALDPEQPHLAHHLQAAGYQTALVGKWHLKTRPGGFDHYEVLPGQGRYFDPILRDSRNWDEGGKAFEGFSADVIADRALAWLAQRDKTRPFCLMVHFKGTHEPFAYPPRYDSLYAGTDLPEPATLCEPWPAPEGRPFAGQLLEILGRRYAADAEGRYRGTPWAPTAADSLARRRQIYQKFIKDFLRCGQALDDNLGRLLDYLDAEGISRETVVIYTADQGYFLGEHGFFDKRMMYEEAIRMPLVLRYPAEVPAGQRLDALVLNLDFAPLLMDYAGAVPPSGLEGHSFRPLLRGESLPGWRQDFYYRYWAHQAHRPAHLGIRTQDEKLIFFYGDPLDRPGADPGAVPPSWAYYDLRTDPQEQHNRYADPAAQPAITRLKARLLALRQETGDLDAGQPRMDSLIQAAW